MKIIFTLEDTEDGGVVILMDPPASELMVQALAGQSTMAAAAALALFQRVLEQMLQLCGPDHVESGDTPARVH